MKINKCVAFVSHNFLWVAQQHCKIFFLLTLHIRNAFSCFHIMPQPVAADAYAFPSSFEGFIFCLVRYNYDE